MISALKDLKNSITEAFDFNEATLSGCIDIICCIQDDGSIKSTPFHVRFGKLKVLHSKEKEISIKINGELQETKMKLEKSGEGYFLEKKNIGLKRQVYKRELNDYPSPNMNLISPNCSDDNISDLELQSGSGSDEDLAKATVVEKEKSVKQDEKVESSKVEAFPQKNEEKSGWRWWWFKKESKLENNSEGLPAIIIHNEAGAIINEERPSIEKPTFSSTPLPTPPIQTLPTPDKPKRKESESTLEEEKEGAVKKKGIINSFLGIFTAEKKETNLNPNPIDQNKKNSSKPITPPPEENEANVEKKEESQNLEEEEEEKPVELSLCAHLINEKNEDDLTEIFNAHKVTYEIYCKDPFKILMSPHLLVKIEDHLYEWKIAAPLLISKLVFQQDLPLSIIDDQIENKKSSWKSWFSSNKTHKKEIGNQKLVTPKNENYGSKESLNASPKTEKLEKSENKVYMRKTIKPSSDTLKKFNLKLGKNTITYHVSTKLRGEQTVEGFIYVYEKNTKIIISDIDGTITKSDVLGQLMPIVGKKWCHEGVTKFYQNIHNNGYEILYLTARAIGQSDPTRAFLNSVYLDDLSLPEGPVFLSPDRLMESFQREVIFKTPEVFKIACLRELKSIFPEPNALYAGFGNRDTDAVAYRASGISMAKIFIINTASEIHQMNNTYLKSYLKLNEIVESLLPPIDRKLQKAPEEYNDANFWKMRVTGNVDMIELL